jgi:hypothetical protein
MKRLFSRAVPEAVSLLGLLVLMSGGCSPENNVKAGAPVLTMLSIVEPSGARLDITSDATECAQAVKTDEACDPEADGLCHTSDAEWCTCVPEPAPEEPPCTPDMPNADNDAGASDAGTAEAGANEGGVDALAVVPPDAAVIDAASSDAADGGAPSEAGASDAGTDDGGASDAAAGETPTRKGTWSCKAFAPGSKVIATFDRLLDTAPFTPDAELATATVKTAVTPVPAPVTDYTPNGSTGGFIFPAFGENPGPNISIVPKPSWPGSNTVTVALVKANVHAKDGKTPFESSGGIVDGIVTFKTLPFAAEVAVPPNAFPAPEETDAGTDASDAGSQDDASDAGASDASDAGTDACVPPPPPPREPTTALPDNTPVTITFNAPVDPTTILTHITITADGQAYDAQVTMEASEDGLSVTITPIDTWAKETTFVITVDDMVVDVFMEKIAGAAAGTFTTGDRK